MPELLIPLHGGYEKLLSYQEGGLRERVTRARLTERAKGSRP